VKGALEAFVSLSPTRGGERWVLYNKRIIKVMELITHPARVAARNRALVTATMI